MHTADMLLRGYCVGFNDLNVCCRCDKVVRFFAANGLIVFMNRFDHLGNRRW